MSQGLSSQKSNTAAASAATTTAILVPDSQGSDIATSASSAHTAASGTQSFSSTTDVSHTHTQEVISSAYALAKPLPSRQVAMHSSSPVELAELPRTTTSDSDASSISSRGSTSSKRMASGAMKPTSPSMSAPALAPNVYRRKSNHDTSSRRISELSLQLKTRLTYAMKKVQNGWEQRSIDELESMAASVVSSPLSTTSTVMTRGTFHSPRTAMTSIGGRLRGSEAARDITNVSGAYRSAASSRPGTASSGWPQASPDLRLQPTQQQPIRTLAPAPDIGPKSSSHQHSNSKSKVEAPLRVSTPTPQEQDAVDTLLFMSSPANSQRFSHRPTDSLSIQGSPPSSRGGQFSMSRCALAGSSAHGPPTLYDRASASSEEEAAAYLSRSKSKRGVGNSNADAERHAKRRSYGRLENEMDVDRLLDQMRDVASSEEETDIAIPVAVAKPVVVRM